MKSMACRMIEMKKRICDYIEDIAKFYGIEIKCQYNCNYATLHNKFFFYFDPSLFTKTDIPIIMLPKYPPHECLRDVPVGEYLRVALIKENLLPSDDIIDLVMLLRILNLYSQFKELIISSPEWAAKWSNLYDDYYRDVQNKAIPKELIAQEFFNIPFEAKALKWALAHTYSTYLYIVSKAENWAR